jgi:hypothetical protein
LYALFLDLHFGFLEISHTRQIMIWTQLVI